MEMESEAKGQFFSVSSRDLDSIAAIYGPEALIAYLVLMRGAGKYTSTAWDFNAISDRGGFSTGRAKQACAQLEKQGFIAAKDASTQRESTVSKAGGEPVHGKGDATDNHLRHRWRIEKPESDSDRIYLPNSLVDGVGAKPVRPLARLYQSIQTDIANGIDADKARRDAIMLLITLHRHQNLEMFSGVDPAMWHRQWLPVKPIGRDETHVISDTNFVLHEISQGEEHFGETLLEQAFSHVFHEDDRPARFHLAMKNIRNASMVYDVLVVFTDDPVIEDDGYARVMYPLYIFDGRARKRADEPSLQRAINELAILEYKAEFGRETVFDDEGEMVLNDGGLFRYVTRWGARAVPISVLRLRYRAHDRDTGVGLLEQRRLVEEWERALRQCQG